MTSSNPLLAALGVADGQAAEVIEILRRRGETVATAESLTAGLVCSALTCGPGSSAVVRGGLVVYATDLKAALAGVSPALLDTHGPVHPEVAVALALGAHRRCVATWGVGLTGVAGPDPQAGVAPGRVHIAVAGDETRLVRTYTFTGDRHEVRAQSVAAALAALLAAVSRQ